MNELHIIVNELSSSESAVANQQVCSCGNTSFACISHKDAICMECEKWVEIVTSIRSYEA
jgi:hypothetical protein